MSQLKFVTSRSVYAYRELLAGLTPNFGSAFCQSVLEWCGLLPATDDLFWELHQIHYRGRCVGVTGLYSLGQDPTELWLGWFGLLPDFRKMGFGSLALAMTKYLASDRGARGLMAYVDQSGPLSFYKERGFHRWGSVLEYRSLAPPDLPEWAFENDDDHVIACAL